MMNILGENSKFGTLSSGFGDIFTGLGMVIFHVQLLIKWSLALVPDLRNWSGNKDRNHAGEDHSHTLICH